MSKRIGIDVERCDSCGKFVEIGGLLADMDQDQSICKSCWRERNPITERDYQQVVITLSNGKIGVFFGQVLVKPGDKVTIKNIEFTKPDTLPDNCSWSYLDK